MIEKHGKSIKMTSIKRDLAAIYKAMDENKKTANLWYNGNKSSNNETCRICGSNRRDLFVSMYGKYNYYHCQNCDAIYLDNLPKQNEMYTRDGESLNIKSYIDEEVFLKRVEMISGPKVEFVLDICRAKETKPQKWLDIGCGGGEILEYLKKYDIEPIGIESDPAECRFIHLRGNHVIQKYIDIEKDDPELSALIEKSDIISFINVLEHLVNPVEFIDYLYKNMHKNAIMVFEVPRYPSMASFANLTNPNNVYRHIVPPIHLQIFSDKSIDFLLDKKYRVEGKWFFGQGYTDVVTNAMIQAGKRTSCLYDLMMNISNEVQAIVDKNGFSDQMLIVAIKS